MVQERAGEALARSETLGGSVRFLNVLLGLLNRNLENGVDSGALAIRHLANAVWRLCVS